MEDKIPTGAEAEIRLKKIATESERQQEAHVRGWLELAKKMFDSDNAQAGSQSTTKDGESEKNDEPLQEEISA